MISKNLDEILGERIVSQAALSGGSISAVSSIETASGKKYVLKQGEANGSFPAEATGLNTLRTPGVLRVPEVISFGPDFILMEQIKTVRPGRETFRDFGRRLAMLHRSTSDRFGFHEDNFIGALPQRNAARDDLAGFFGELRFLALTHLGLSRGRLGVSLAGKVEKLCGRLPDLFSSINEPPALLHGDLWSGNFLVSGEGVVLIDPAVYYGPREADLAMTRLFGGFPEEFHAAYQEEYPLPEGHRDRVDLFNLYHLLTHTIMFGGGYASQAEAQVDRYL